MDNEKPINKRLIIISFIVLAFLTGSAAASEPQYFSDQASLIIGFLVVLVGPLVAIWFKALWNEIIPRVTSWRKITYIEALGLMTLLLLVVE